MRYFLEISYLGTNYHGWQIQPNSITIQGVLEDCMSKLLKLKIKLVGAGRTDTGVHANQMFAHFDMDHDFDTHNIVVYLNQFECGATNVEGESHKPQEDDIIIFDGFHSIEQPCNGTRRVVLVATYL